MEIDNTHISTATWKLVISCSHYASISDLAGLSAHSRDSGMSLRSWAAPPQPGEGMQQLTLAHDVARPGLRLGAAEFVPPCAHSGENCTDGHHTFPFLGTFRATPVSVPLSVATTTPSLLLGLMCSIWFPVSFSCIYFPGSHPT